MARKSAADTAKDALAKLMRERDAAALKLAKIDDEIAELREALGMSVVQPMPKHQPKSIAEIEASLPIQEEPGVILENLAPQDDMGPGRVV